MSSEDGETIMMRKGKINQQVEALSLTLATLLGLKREGKTQELEACLKNACKELTGLDWGLTMTLTTDSLLSLLTTDNHLDVGRCATLAVLLHEQGILDEERGLVPVAQNRYRKAARLLSEAMQSDSQLRTSQFQARLADLAGKLQAGNKAS
jgi:hypothetical protein